jgi:DNA-binding SARP family transcriptional activator/TolB-like protein/Tfp pilus assembly protein PilF
VVELHLLGPAQLAGSNGQDSATLTRQPKRMALLAYLAVAKPRGFHRRDKLVALFWPELDEPHARNSLSQALHVIRAALGDDAVQTRGDEEVGLNAGALTADVWQFEAALRNGESQDALRLYKGDLLDGLIISSAPEFERWLDGERAHFRQVASAAGWKLAQSKADSREPMEAARLARWAAGLLLPDETQLRHLMRFLHGLGDRSAAVRAYEEFTRRLASEYDLQPSAESQALASDIRRDTGVVPFRDPPAAPVVRPDSQLPLIEPRDVKRSQGSRRWRLGIAAFGGLLLLAGVGATFELKAHPGKAAPVGPKVVRLAVLPFQNLGSAENSYFADGIADEIATRLAVIRGLNVVSGTAAERYATAATATSSSAPNRADFFLKGTTSWVPSKAGRGHIRVRIQLVDASDGRELWGAVIEENINATAEIFALYSNVAQRVVDDLDLILETPRQDRVTTLPTTSLEAYNDYLRGKDYLRRTSTAINFEAAIRNLEAAVQRDTNFALAYALLAHAHSEGVWLAGLNRAHLDTARIVGERALAIDPDLPEAHTYLGWYYYVCCEDDQRAMWHLTKSHAMRPGDYQIVMLMGSVQKREGRFPEAITLYHEAIRLDPLARWPRNNLGHAQMWSRQYDSAEQAFRQVLASEPQDIFAYAHLAWLLVLRDGDVKAADQIVSNARQSSDGFAEMRMPYYLALLERRYDAALATLTSPQPGLTASLLNEWLVDDAIRRGLVLRLKGDSARASVDFDSARKELESALLVVSPQSRRDVLWLRSGLAIAYAGLGRREDAKREVDFVLGSNPLKVDAIEGPKYLEHVALADVMLDNRSGAIDVLEGLMAVSSPVSSHSLRLEPFWDPLRHEPRFARMVTERR